MKQSFLNLWRRLKRSIEAEQSPLLWKNALFYAAVIAFALTISIISRSLAYYYGDSKRAAEGLKRSKERLSMKRELYEIDKKSFIQWKERYMGWRGRAFSGKWSGQEASAKNDNLNRLRRRHYETRAFGKAL